MLRCHAGRINDKLSSPEYRTRIVPVFVIYVMPHLLSLCYYSAMILKPFKTIRRNLYRNRWYICLGLAALIIVDVLQLIIPRIIKRTVDALTDGTATQDMLLTFAAGVILIGIGMFVFRFLWRYAIIGTSRRIELDLRDRLFSHLLSLPFSSMQRTPTGDFMARMTNDLESVRMCAGIGLVASVDTIFLGIASLAFMIYISPALTLYTLTPMIMIIVLTWRYSYLLHHRFAGVQASFSTLTEAVRETLFGIGVVKSYVLEQERMNMFRRASSEYIRKNMALIKVMGLLFPGIILLSNTSIAVLLYAGGSRTILGDITAGDFVAFASYLWILTWPMMATGWVVNLIQRGSASMIRINQILETKPETDHYNDNNTGGSLSPVSISIQNLYFSFSYGAEPVLRSISLAVGGGSSLGIIGTTGAGKTTLCSLLLRLYSVPPATIFFNGIDIAGLPLRELRKMIAYVPQDSFLFSDTIAHNMAFGNPGAPFEHLREQAECAGLLDDIQSFRHGFDTLVGEKGVTLSGGQKQRLCLARARLVNAPLLIIDDALSSLDANTAQYVLRSLTDERGKRTTIIVSTRVSHIAHADTIIVLERGEIIDTGTHNRLLSRDGIYRQLYLTQQLESTQPGS